MRVFITILLFVTVSLAKSKDFVKGEYTGIASYFNNPNTTCGSQSLTYSRMTCNFGSDDFDCRIESNPAWNLSGLYSYSEGRLALSANKSTICLSLTKTFNEMVALYDKSSPSQCPSDSASQCNTAGTTPATFITWDLFGPGLSSFELFGILVGCGVVVILIAIIAEALRSRTISAPSSPSTIKFFVIAMGMTIAGTINTISTKFADLSFAEGIDGTIRPFSHPFFQAGIMFVGEMLCGLVAIILIVWERCRGPENSRDGRSVNGGYSPIDGDSNQPLKYNPAIFILPALCDLISTCMLYVGLLWTYASVFQMLRGSVVIWTGIFSLIFLKNRLYLFHWAGMLFVLAGLALVGVASMMLGAGANAPHPIPGDLLVLGGCVITATQMVVEEKFINKYRVPPLQVVGFEGLFGFLMLTVVLIVMYFIPGNSAGNHFENALDAFIQIANSRMTLYAVLGNLFSIAFFNFFGISMTSYSSATTRTVIDTIRTVVIWSWGLLVGWQAFQYLQVIGFALLLIGTMVYNRIITLPINACKPPPPQTANAAVATNNSEKQPLLTQTSNND